MASLDARLTRLEKALGPAHDPQPWAEVDAAQRRLGERLGLAASDPWIVEAMTWLADETPGRR
jgi:hypothetical protein